MILDPVNASQQSKKEQEALQQRSEREQEEYTEDRPPEYTSVPQNDSTPDGAGASSPPPPLAMSTGSTDLRSTRNLPDLKPSNFVHLSRSNSSVKGVWIVDPSMVIPAAFLPPLEGGQTEETRENLYLFSKNGAVDAEVYLLPRTVPVEDRSHGAAAALVDTKTALRPQVIFRARSNNGSVTLKIHEVPPEPPRSLKPSLVEEVPRSPIHINCWSSNGSVNIYLPRSFQGPLSLSTRNGSVHFSDAIKPLLTHFSEVNGGQRSFLGDFDARKWSNGLISQSGSGSGSGGEWVGDMLKADSMNGSVRVAFDDEQDRSASSSSKSNSKSQGGFFGRIFGGF